MDDNGVSEVTGGILTVFILVALESAFASGLLTAIWRRSAQKKK